MAGPADGISDGLSDVASTPVLELRGVTAGYGRATVLRDVSFSVAPGSVTALLGPNGSGKTTTLRTVSGIVKPSAGSVLLGGADVTRKAPHRRAEKGLCLIPEGRGIFRSLTVRDNLRMQVPPWRRGAAVDAAITAFPVLGQRLDQVAGSLSGGQQQMLALGRAYLADPTVVLLDEVSMGLAPRVVDEIFGSLRALAATGVALVVVEQYVTRALELADQVVLLDRGTVGFCGSPATLDEAELMKSYLGVDVASGGAAPSADAGGDADAAGGRGAPKATRSGTARLRSRG
ncbi:MAG TPA: ABC transporter ATP-binding protein [Mycobacteriales bacterium]|nr:ABC transporter ATP-binding protein [Mycobacteriales bacterium]